MTQAPQALVYAMLVEGHYDRQARNVGRSSRRRTRTPILRRFAE
jgi:hypothetical protein